MNKGLRNELSTLSALGAFGALLLGRPRWAAPLGAMAAGLRLIPGRKYDYFGKSVVITGGSRGLGLALAQELVRKGARVTVLARDVNELSSAESLLKKTRCSRVLTVPCDITRPEQLAHAFKLAYDHFGRLDMLINNAGAITVGPFETMSLNDFQTQFELHVNAVVEATQLVLRYFKKMGGGRIINISSIGGTIPIPHMTAYCATKYGLAGFSRSVAAELRSRGVYVTTVYPGLMRTGSPIQAVFKGDQKKEFAWFAVGDYMPGLSISARSAARRILQGAAVGKSEVIVSLPAKLGAFVERNFPEVFLSVMSLVAGFLPHGHSDERLTGAEARDWFEKQGWSKPLSALAHRLEKRMNQQEKFDADYNIGLH